MGRSSRLRSFGVLLAGAAVAAASTAASTPAVTIVARAVIDPNEFPRDRVVALSGTASGARAGEDVIIEARRCGPGNFFRIAGAASATAGGSWSARLPADQGTHFRARFRDATSDTATVRWPAPVHAYTRRIAATRRRPAATRIHAVVSPQDSSQNFRGRVVELQRNAGGGNWVLVRRTRLRQFASYSFLTEFTVRRRGLSLRVLVPEASAAPCYLAGVSETVRS